MKQYRVFNKVAVVAFAAVLAACVSVQAADVAGGLEKLSEISAKVTEAKAKLAEAANKGDVMGAAEAARRAQAADTAMAEAMAAFSAFERALAAGNNDAAAAALENLRAAGQKVVGALSGPVPEEGAGDEEPKKEEPKEEKDDSWDPPNTGENLTDTEGLRSLFDDLFKDFWNATGGIGDSDATPE
jgi:hypothetical protein